MYITVHHSIHVTVFTQFNSVLYIGQLIVDNIAQPSSTIESGFSPVRDDSDIMLPSSKNRDVGIGASS